MKILLTGFDPFGGDKVNPAYEAVKLLPKNIAGADIITIEIPTVYQKSGEIVERGIRQYQPDVVICIGQAGGRSGMTVEKVAVNIADFRIADNEGNQPLNQSILEDGENAYFATVPVKAMVENIKKHGIPARTSYTAGTFVCNDVMYELLYMISKKYPKIKGGFIHVPFAPEQVLERPDGTASMPLETTAKALEYAVEAVVREESK